MPTIKTKGIKTYNSAYHFKVLKQKLEFPLHIAFPIPEEAKEKLDGLVFIKISEGKEEIVLPSSVDKEKGYATLLCRSFSTYIPGSWDIDFPFAHVHGDLSLQSGCEEEPDVVYFDMTCLSTMGGNKANFVYQVFGITDFELFMPLPLEYFGTYTFHRLIGNSDNFIYTMKPLSKTLNIDGSSSDYHISLNVIPSTTRIKGKVKDQQGDPIAGVEITLEANDGMSYNTKSRGDGSYLLELIGISDPQNAPTETYTYELVNPEEDLDCDTCNGTLTATAGKTLNTDLVFKKEGWLSGLVKDQDSVPLAGAKVTLITEESKSFSTTTDATGNYKFGPVLAGEVEVTATCLDGKRSQTQITEVKCARNEMDARDFLDFDLDCSEGYTFSISHSGAMESEGKYLGHKVSTTAEFSLFLPKKEDEASTEVTYSVEHHLTAKKGNKLEFIPDKTNFTLDAVVRWTVRKTVNRHGVVEFGFEREVIDADSQKFNFKMYENGEYIDTMDTAYENLIELALISPKVTYIKEKDLPFKKNYKRQSSIPVNAGAIPGGDSIRTGKTQHRTSLVIECDSCNEKK